jgi:sugar-specific transcriptional regulator TrmB
MDKSLIQTLQQLGCNEKHIRFYEANRHLGTSALSAIIKQARLQRSTGYLIAAEMLQLGLIEEDHKAYKKQYTPVEPSVLLRKLEAHHRRVGRTILAYKEALPTLQAEHHATNTRPKVRTFEDRSGLVSVWRDILQSQQEILLWSNQNTEQLVFDTSMHEQFIAERIAKHIPIRVLAIDSENAYALKRTDSDSLRQTKILPSDMQFTGETYIYGNKVAVLDFGKKIFGVITENDQIAEAQRSIFNFTWHHIE